MIKELLIIFTMAISGIFFALGGTGWKWFRRFVLPVVLCVIIVMFGFSFLQAIICCVGFILVFCLGYGETKPTWWKLCIGFLFISPTFILGLTLWQAITPIVWAILYSASNSKTFSKFFPWKIVEFLTGVLLGITICSIK